MKRTDYFLFVMFLFFLINNSITAQIQIDPAFPNLTFEQPVDIQHSNDGTNRLFVLSQLGKIIVFENDSAVSSSKVFLDLTDKVLSGGEQGLLGLAFHPDYKNNGYFYVDYTANNPRRTIISRFTVSPTDADAADAGSEQILLEVNQPYSNHNGGQVRFGPDGYLYIVFGDGGSGGDPQNNAQNLQSLLGKILRIDIDKTQGSLNYSIPPDNPFVNNTTGNREEIYAYGLRNPWRFSFDNSTGMLWAADVGQNQWEEIDIIEKGKNYGWRIMEGFHCYNPSSGCDTSGITLPIWEYQHNDQGGYSVTGGFVYRGNNAQQIYGKYIYADFSTGKIWTLEYDGNNVNNTLLSQTSYSISTFGIDQNNELYFADYNAGKIYKFRGSPNTGVDNETLQYGFELKQNYPNPFNPETKISYSIPRNGRVQLKVFDGLGREILTLTDDVKDSGVYETHINLSNYASGVYLCTLSFEGLRLTKKLSYIK